MSIPPTWMPRTNQRPGPLLRMWWFLPPTSTLTQCSPSYSNYVPTTVSASEPAIWPGRWRSLWQKQNDHKKIPFKEWTQESSFCEHSHFHPKSPEIPLFVYHRRCEPSQLLSSETNLIFFSDLRTTWFSPDEHDGVRHCVRCRFQVRQANWHKSMEIKNWSGGFKKRSALIFTASLIATGWNKHDDQ